MTLEGTRILLVGGTSGIGLAVAQAVAERGATPVVAARDRGSVERALGALPDRAEGATVDLNDGDSIAGLVKQAETIDHLVYTAGEPFSITMLPDLTPDVVLRFWQTRYFGALAVVRALSTAGAIHATGSIVLTGGIAAHRPVAGWALFASVCGAMDSLGRELAVELAPVRVNVVAPGLTRSPLYDSMPAKDREAMYDGLAASLPVGRVAETADVALAYVYAMEQPMATGTSITVDGGAVLV